jgi:hypothetical protein
VPAAVVPAASAPPGGSVAVSLSSSRDGRIVPPGTRVNWEITAFVSPSDNRGLALISVDLVQDPNNPELHDLRRGDVALGAMRQFDWPKGFSNPGDPLAVPMVSGFGGTPTGLLGQRDLTQIGGAQNTFGLPGPCLGDAGDICTGQDIIPEIGVGQLPEGVRVTKGSFRAPVTPGTYRFSLANLRANTLDVVNAPPQASVVQRADVTVLNGGDIEFTVPAEAPKGDVR